MEPKDQMKQILSHLEAEVIKLNAMAAHTNGKFVNVASNGLVMTGYPFSGCGINYTGYDTEASDAMIFDTYDECYRYGNFYMHAVVNCRTVPVYVNAVKADEFFTSRAKELNDTAAVIRARLNETTR